MFSPKDFIHVLCISLRVRAVELVILVKPIGIFTRVNEHLFRDKNSHVFKHLNCSRHCRDSCDASNLRLLILLRLSHNLKSRRVFILNG